MNNITGYLINAHERKHERVEFKPKLENYYEMLKCECIDIITRKIGNKAFDIIVDDEGLFVQDPIQSGLTFSKKEVVEQLVGNLLVVGKADCEGKEQSLTDEDVELIRQNVRIYVTKEEELFVKRPVLFLSI